jgi:hypothetical protein
VPTGMEPRSLLLARLLLLPILAREQKLSSFDSLQASELKLLKFQNGSITENLANPLPPKGGYSRREARFLSPASKLSVKVI